MNIRIDIAKRAFAPIEVNIEVENLSEEKVEEVTRIISETTASLVKAVQSSQRLSDLNSS